MHHVYGWHMTSDAIGTDAREARREELLAAARAVLAEHGYERTTVSSIATRANVAQGTFYLYFPSKEALPGALAEQVHEALGAATYRVTEQPANLEDAVEALVGATFEAAEGYKDVLPIANRGVELASDWDEWCRITAPWRDALEHFLRTFQELGSVDASLDVATTAYVLRDLLDRAAKARVLFGQQEYALATATLVRRALAS
jgi:AcrR family transcriptional regulator